jgi:hypothetical protein
MSQQRAAINCERCYDLINDIRSDIKPVAHMGRTESHVKREVTNSNDIYITRNEAMKALEAVIPWIQYDKCTEKKALDACMNCDYSSPKIAELVRGKSKEGN